MDSFQMILRVLNHIVEVLNELAPTVLAVFTVVLAIATIKLHRSTKRYAELSLFDFAERLLRSLYPFMELSKTLPSLCSIGSEFQTDLENETISGRCRQELEKHRLSLSRNASVSTKERTNTEWVISDGNMIYEARKHDDKIDIYMDLDTVKQKALLSYGNLLRKGLDSIEREISQGDRK